VTLNRAVEVGMADGPAAGLAIVDTLGDDAALQGYHLLPSVRGDLLARLDRDAEARIEFERAAALARNARERTLLRGARGTMPRGNKPRLTISIALRQRHRLAVAAHVHAVQKSHAQQGNREPGLDHQTIDLIDHDPAEFDRVERDAPGRHNAASRIDRTRLPLFCSPDRYDLHRRR
jgi:RNA polymerase, sigma subunit, ECF family